MLMSSLRLSNPLIASNTGTGPPGPFGKRSYPTISLASNGIRTISNCGSNVLVAARNAASAFAYDAFFPADAGTGQRPNEYNRHARMYAPLAFAGSLASSDFPSTI